MKIGVWNCAQALPKKLAVLRALDPDICVIPEAGRELGEAGAGTNYLWQGKNKSKGLGVISVSTALKVSEHSDHNWHYFLPLESDKGEYRILAVWAFNHRARRNYGEGAIGEPLKIFGKLERWLTEKETYILGDFNNSVVFDRPGKPANFANTHNWLAEHGFASAYHSYFREGMGGESKPTYYYRKSLSSPYHIDYIYTNRPQFIKSVRIGGRDEWLAYSDHVPILLETK